jgi:hypothetical protein
MAPKKLSKVAPEIADAAIIHLIGKTGERLSEAAAIARGASAACQDGEFFDQATTAMIAAAEPLVEEAAGFLRLIRIVHKSAGR